ncbi:winged helix-turn-helix transcriptional regulator [Salsipaludibacter albus]|uniref:winged helix-turn-helix transcriptional regulator n=1 Tax=Salsipaludibacter albus TaxID=2849650 RepID=UPI001EE4400A|nr:helix-turn-helix domain-containing protein [Salsipaludibacter albus]MBY5162022.1 helix-turn-helix transcriptional regulator [Salsipaludibacter albus]
MASSYGQFCPVAKAMELLDERWTMLVVREMIAGSQHFNDIRRGVPNMSPTLLSKRLRTLGRAGVVERWEHGNRVTYQLTQAGRELVPIVEALGQWGIRWIGELGEEDLDPHLLMWDLRRNIAVDRMPPGRTVIGFTFPDLEPAARDWWAVVTDEVDICDHDPGFEVHVRVLAPLRTMVQVWRGDIGWADATRSGDLVVEGPSRLRSALPEWFLLSDFAATPRPGPEAVTSISVGG